MFVGCLCPTNNSSSCSLENFLFLTWSPPNLLISILHQKNSQPPSHQHPGQFSHLYIPKSRKAFPNLLLHALFSTKASHLNPAICCQYHKQLLPLPDGICLAARPLLGLLLQSLRASTGLQSSTSSPSKQLTSLQRHPTT
jgi:hypothetical protein